MTTAAPTATPRLRAGPVARPDEELFWILDRRSMKPEFSRGLPRAKAFERLRQLLRHRDAFDPWRERLGVWVVRGAPRRSPAGQIKLRHLARREVIDPVLVADEIRARRVRLHWEQVDLAAKAGFNKSVVCHVEAGDGCGPDTIAALRAVLRRVEIARGFRPKHDFSARTGQAGAGDEDDDE